MPARNRERAPIRQLPPQLVNQIAAGEVVERPASVVKELVENSLDAGAGNIEVELRGGGIQQIRITDDGHGIPADELALAVASHATSKVCRLEDLFGIATLGFRGEALSSIGSVSDLRITSTASGQPEGATVSVTAGTTAEVRPAAHPEGTTIVVDNLFYNVPARRKFLKSATSELRRVAEVLEQLACGHPHVGFVARHEGRELLSAPSTRDPLDRLRRLYGHKGTEELLRVEEGGEDLALLAFASPPHLTRGDRKRQLFFLNGRPLADPLLFSAVSRAYDGLLMVRRHPWVFAYLAVDPQLVDQNVHPQKAEVRFQNGRRVFGLIAGGLRQALLQADSVPELVLSANPPAPLRRPPRQQRLALQPAPLGGATPTARLPARQPQKPPEGSRPAGPHPGTPAQTPAPPAPAAPGGYQPGRALQIHQRYLVAETADGLTIIDPHALHEKLLYLKLEERALAGQVACQQLLTPEPVAVSQREALLFAEHREVFSQLGFDIAEFGEGTLLLRAFPAILRSFSGDDLRTLLSRLGDGSRATRQGLFREVLARLACHGAVRFGEALSPEEMMALLRQRAAERQSNLCPHGRPTEIRLSLHELDRRFGRHGGEGV